MTWSGSWLQLRPQNSNQVSCPIRSDACSSESLTVPVWCCQYDGQFVTVLHCVSVPPALCLLLQKLIVPPSLCLWSQIELSLLALILHHNWTEGSKCEEAFHKPDFPKQLRSSLTALKYSVIQTLLDLWYVDGDVTEVNFKSPAWRGVVFYDGKTNFSLDWLSAGPRPRLLTRSDCLSVGSVFFKRVYQVSSVSLFLTRRPPHVCIYCGLYYEGDYICVVLTN